MNIGSPQASAAPAEAHTGQVTAARREAASRRDPHNTRDEFERALHAKAQPLVPEDPLCTTPQPDPAAWATPMMAWVAAPLAQAAPAPAHSAAGVTEVATGTRAAIEAALQNAEPQAVGPLAATERPAVWEASVGGPHGSVELRAERVVTQGAPAAWALSIDSPGLNADAATRHTPRLHERLRKQGIEVDHVRIERKSKRDDDPR